MKQDLRMNAKSPDPDDLANDEPLTPSERDTEAPEQPAPGRTKPDRSAPHIPPLEKGKIRGE